MNNRSQYTSLAHLFRYPREEYKEQVRECVQLLEKNYPEAYELIKPFAEIVQEKEDFEIEEIFGRTFHIQAICYLDLGYVLYAEDYKRGEFLVNMKNEQRKVNNDCGDELADNLPNVFTLMALIEDAHFLEELTVRMIIPALKKMLEEFDASRIKLKTKVMKKKQKVIIQEDMEHKNIYQHAIQAALKVLQTDYVDVNEYKGKEVVPDVLSSFIPACGTCSEDHSETGKKKEKELEKVEK